MASVEFDMRGATIGLDHQETNELLGILTPIGGFGGIATIAAFFTKIGIATALGASGPYIATAIAVHIAWESAVIKISDRGDGVWLTVPPPVLINMPGVIIPSTRTSPRMFDGNANDGTMVSQLSDEITWHIDRGVGVNNECKFVLVNNCNWDKAYKLYIGAGTWWVGVGGHQAGENGAYFNELPTTQIVFHKPQFLGQWGPVGLTISNFAGLNANDTVTFTWVKDT